MRILFDVTRTLVHSRKKTPTGIDRVEHAYIRYLLNEADDNYEPWFIVTSPFGQGALSAKQMARIFNKIEECQQENVGVEDSPAFCTLSSVLSKPIDKDLSTPLSIREKSIPAKDSLASVVSAVGAGFLRFRQLMNEKKPAVYMHTSHLLLDKPKYFDWLKRHELFPIFFIHDLIPIEFPEFCTLGSEARHIVRMETILEHARGLITNSQFTHQSFLKFADGRATPPVHVAPLANTIRDVTPKVSNIPIAGAPYFLHVGTIEGRKNISHLLNAWREVIARMGKAQAPRLVLVGRRGWECETVASILDRSHQLASHLIEVSDISDPELRRLMLGSAGLITVSLSEGYGLPPVEAAQMGTPVIASDIPAHREILGNTCIYVSPHDGAALVDAVVNLARQPAPQRLVKEIMPWTWREHVQTSLSFANAIFCKEYRNTPVQIE